MLTASFARACKIDGRGVRDDRGVYVFNVATIEEAEKLVMLDPAVKASVFVPDLTPWYASAALMIVPETHKRIAKQQLRRQRSGRRPARDQLALRTRSREILEK